MGVMGMAGGVVVCRDAVECEWGGVEYWELLYGNVSVGPVYALDDCEVTFITGGWWWFIDVHRSFGEYGSGNTLRVLLVHDDRERVDVLAFIGISVWT